MSTTAVASVSGQQLYISQFEKLSGDICNGATASVAQINDVMPNSISRTDLPVDNTTQRISQTALNTYVSGLVSANRVPAYTEDLQQQISADKEFYDAVRKEYCFYESRYRAALGRLIDAISAPGTIDQGLVSSSLASAKALNARLNSLLEIMNYVGNDRAGKVNQRNTDVAQTNTKLQSKVEQLNKQREFLMASDVRLQTQNEMIRYSAEKNRSMNIQIMFFVALNVIALGTVLTVYKSL